MKRTFQLYNLIPIALALIGFVSIAWWITHDPVDEMVTSEPGMDNRGEGVAVNMDIKIGEFFEEFGNSTSSLDETWPGFRGENHDNIVRSKVALIDQFGPEGADIKWTVKTGEGYAGAAIYEGKVYMLDYNEELRADMLRCFDLVEGTELWRRWYKVPIKRNHGMSRSVPTVTEDYIITMGPKSHVMCVDRESGEFRWGLNVEAEYLPEIPDWYTAQCPLVDDGKLIVAAGGTTTLMLAIDCESGEILWETPNVDQLGMSHSSIMPYEFEGVRMYVYSAIGGVCGVAADGANAGELLWTETEWNQNVVAPSPVCMPDGKIFVSAGYGAGSMVIQLKKEGENFYTEVLQEYLPKEGLACEQQTPVEFEGHLFGISPKDAGPLRSQLICVHPDDFTDVIWSSGQTVRFGYGYGPYVIADGKMFILSGDGTLTIARPSVREYIQLDQTKVLDGHDAWGPLAIADGYLVMRDAENLLCIDIAKKPIEW